MKLSEAAILHRNVPPDWYKRGINENIFQRFWHHRRFSEIKKLIEPNGGKILDIGCADGTLTKIILDHSKANLIIGIDILPSSISFAKKRFTGNKKLKFMVADAENLPFEKEEFDAIFCFDSIEHFLEPEKALKEIRRVLKKGGYLLILVHTNSLLFRAIWFFWENTRGWIWKGTHINDFSKNGLREMIASAGFKNLDEKKFMLGMYRLIKARE